MAIQPVVQYTETGVRIPSEPVTLQDVSAGKFRKLIRDMAETMKAENGVGIAAPQIGVNFRIIIVETKSGSRVLVNPSLQRRSIRRETMEEGCLSVKGVFGPVSRHRSVTVHGWNEHGQAVQFRAEGFLARIFQHEVDHLNGTLFIDRARSISQGTLNLKKWKRPV